MLRVPPHPLLYGVMENFKKKIQDILKLGIIRESQSLCTCCCCWLPDPFRGMMAWRKTMEPQMPGNSPGSEPEVVKRQRVVKV